MVSGPADTTLKKCSCSSVQTFMFIELNRATGSVCVKGSTTFSPKVTGKPESRDRLTEGGYGLIVVIAAGVCVCVCVSRRKAREKCQCHTAVIKDDRLHCQRRQALRPNTLHRDTPLCLFIHSPLHAALKNPALLTQSRKHSVLTKHRNKE